MFNGDLLAFNDVCNDNIDRSCTICDVMMIAITVKIPYDS